MASSSTGPRQMARIEKDTKENKINLLTNHFKVNFTNTKSQDFFQYNVDITYEDKNPVEGKDKDPVEGKDKKTPVEGKGISRKILAKVQQTKQTELGSKMTNSCLGSKVS
ncbi:unnamed protein product [Eruca vesicaria subsp. sativa]|uniref:Protein argonaute N-terminal domain-containing protein n=1 Tax=Eruca vesicaria subsp. sativa TaxID=29727 RepID=A0ABC8LIC7_ERUVS|nr:unnamed protein product [Eruca vesicaria subsp. sativa]